MRTYLLMHRSASCSFTQSHNMSVYGQSHLLYGGVGYFVIHFDTQVCRTRIYHTPTSTQHLLKRTYISNVSTTFGSGTVSVR